MNINQLKKYCLADKKEFLGGGRYRFIDNGSNVLAVAHVDTVADFSKDRTHNFEVHGDVVTSIALDDRLGLWIIMEVLPLFGIVPDILITDDEEIGQSTAQFFEPDKQYNWMFSFDRSGFDCVLYDYDNQEMRDKLGEFGFPVGIGSFSDISFLTHIGCRGINVGTGYYAAHTKNCNARISDVITQVELFSMFYYEYENTEMPYDGKSGKYDYLGGEWTPDWEFHCVYCNDILTDDSVSDDDPDICQFCENALRDVDYQMWQDEDYIDDDYNTNDAVVRHFVDKLMGKSTKRIHEDDVPY